MGSIPTPPTTESTQNLTKRQLISDHGEKGDSPLMSRRDRSAQIKMLI